MVLHPRQERILALIEADGSARTMDLAGALDVTDETIRRDLQTLSEHGLVQRVHGGAASLRGRARLRTFTERRSQRVAQKQAIAEVALGLLEPGQTLAFDSSTTAFEVVSRLNSRPHRVLTNAHPVAHQIIDLPEIELVLFGGIYEAKTQTYIGPEESFQPLSKHRIDWAIISCVGLDPERGASEGFEQQALFKEQLVRHADRLLLLADSSKIGVCSDYFFCPPSNITRLVTDDGIEDSQRAALEAAGITVVTPQRQTPHPLALTP